jgi:hypothetical protein
VIALGAVVDVKELWQTVAAAMIAGVGITATFSLVIFAAARYSEAARSGNGLAAALTGSLAIVSLVVTVAAIVLGMIVMTSK